MKEIIWCQQCVCLEICCDVLALHSINILLPEAKAPIINRNPKSTVATSCLHDAPKSSPPSRLYVASQQPSPFSYHPKLPVSSNPSFSSSRSSAALPAISLEDPHRSSQASVEHGLSMLPRGQSQETRWWKRKSRLMTGVCRMCCGEFVMLEELEDWRYC